VTHAHGAGESLDQGTSPMMPRLTVEECLHYTLTCDPDVALLGMSFPDETQAAVSAAARFEPLDHARMAEIELEAARAMEGKGECWWNPPGG